MNFTASVLQLSRHRNSTRKSSDAPLCAVPIFSAAHRFMILVDMCWPVVAVWHCSSLAGCSERVNRQDFDEGEYPVGVLYSECIPVSANLSESISRNVHEAHLAISLFPGPGCDITVADFQLRCNSGHRQPVKTPGFVGGHA